MTGIPKVFFCSIALGVVVLPALTFGVPAIAADSAKATAEFVDTDGTPIGSASLFQGSTGVLIHVNVSGIAPGAHAIHIHSIGTCTPDFKASAGHINIHDRQHGLLNPDGPDNGDLPNIYVASDGVAEAELFTTRVTLSDGGMGDAALLFDDDGSALVIHEAPDDHMTQPIGGAGGRIACGIISAVD